MSTVSKSFTAVGVGAAINVAEGGAIDYTLTGTFVGTAYIEKVVGGGAGAGQVVLAAVTAPTSGRLSGLKKGQYRWRNSAFTSGTLVTTLVDAAAVTQASATSQDDNASKIGAVASVAGLQCDIERVGHLARLKFTLTNVSITHTDAAGSGSSGSIKLFDFVLGAVQVLATKRTLTWTGDALIDTNAGDMAFKAALGSVAADAGDGALTGTEVDLGPISGTITLSSKVATATTLTGAGAAVADGTATATDLYLNESGTAATSDANGVLLVTGTIEVLCAILGNGV